MDSEVDEILNIFESSLSEIKWRMKHSSKLRLQTDILALWTEMRPVIMVDYGGEMPELQERLCAFLQHCQQQSSAFQHLRVMVIEEMIYLINVKALADFVQSVMIVLKESVSIVFSGSTEPAAYGELVSVGEGYLTPAANQKITSGLAELLEAKLNIPKIRFFLKFFDSPGAMFGWNGNVMA